MKFKFEIDGIGVQFDTIYRMKIETGLKYQIEELIGFWKSRKEHGYILVYKRNAHNEFENQPFQIAKVFKDGNYTMLTVEEWEKDRKR